ncbi:MAG TPA: cysteine--tRNA ligase [Nitrososphaerales archaeon]|nr:cysteine--tRNA ligase [Nitrososphaerales archaeon]
MPLRLFNSMGRRLQVFTPLREGEVRMYTCGPTVWNYAHIGNFRTFVFEDLLRRYLRFKGYRVTQVMNITDVEDKIIKGMKRFGKSRKELSDFFEAAFKEDLAALGVEPADIYPRATEHIDEMVTLINRLLAGGYAYRSDDGSYYYDISKFPRYGALSGIRPGELKAGARVAQDEYEKDEASDFALWKAWDPDDGEVYWETELGKGRPGWHIECSAMSMKYLGEEFDIHTGGVDNKFPHHENEIAQSEAATGKKFVSYWLHSAHLSVSGAAMHKSVGNEVYLRDLLKAGWDPKCIRLFLAAGRYRDQADLTDENLKQATAQCERLRDFVGRLRSAEGAQNAGAELAAKLLAGFEAAMDDDLNTADALASVFDIVKKGNTLMDSGRLGAEAAGALLSALRRIDEVLGIMTFEEDVLPERTAKLIADREEARRRRDFAAADRIRAQLLDEGIVVEDSPKGTVWKRKRAG